MGVLSLEKRDEIYVAMPSSFTVDGHNIQVSKLYSNQFTGATFPTITIDPYPLETLNIEPLQKLFAFNSSTDTDLFIDTKAELYDTYAINVFTRTNKVNGARMADVIASTLRNWFYSEMSIEGVHVRYPPSPIQNLDQTLEDGIVFRRRFTVRLYYAITDSEEFMKIKEIQTEVNVNAD